MAHIEARDITLTYDTPGGTVPGVCGVSFGMEASEFLCIVGPSGCGKSTLLNIIAGFLKPTSGEIRIGGAPVNGYGMDRGIVFQDFAQLFPWRTALGNVAFGLEMKGMPKAERETVALEQLRLVKLENFARSYPHHLSGGMQQRVAIARALAYNPAVLLMDEPFAALDALTRDDMQRLLADVWRETRKTVIYVTHNVAEAVYLADRVVVMTPHPGTVQNRSADPSAAAARSAERRIPRLSEGTAAPSRTGHGANEPMTAQRRSRKSGGNNDTFRRDSPAGDASRRRAPACWCSAWRATRRRGGSPSVKATRPISGACRLIT